MNKWSELKYWKSGEWQVIQEKLNDLKREGRTYCPDRKDLFRALRACRFDSTRVCIIGQDPYPNRSDACGLAFSIPPDATEMPRTLKNIFKEYVRDLSLNFPTSGDLTPWCEQGVLLWNAYPSCEEGHPGSHHWDEWTYLTKEILNELGQKESMVFIFLGSVSWSFRDVLPDDALVLKTSHPSPLGAKYGFLGSSIFSRTNELLEARSLSPIDWRLP